MKYLKLFLFSLLFSAACCTESPIIEENRKLNLLIYFAADNSLSDAAVADFADLKTGYVPSTDGYLFVYFKTSSDPNAKLYRLQTVNGTVQETVIKEYGEVNSCDPKLMHQVLTDSRVSYAAERYGLVLWSHGTGWLPEGSYGENPMEILSVEAESAEARSPYQGFLYNIHDPRYPRVKSFGRDKEREMEISALREALGSYSYDFIAFDACLMGSIEVAYELRDHCRYFVASPAEILADGFPYERLGFYMFTDRGEPDLRGLCAQFYESYAARSGFFQAATISLLESAKLEAVAQTLRPIVEAHRKEIQNIDPGSVQVYDRLAQPLFFDLDHFVQNMASGPEYKTFHAVLEAATVYKAATPKFITIEINHFGGVSAYIPYSNYVVLNPAFRLTRWNRAVKLIE